MKKLIEAYKKILHSLLLIIAAAAVIILSGFIIVTPLWLAATKYKRFYTITLFVIAAVLFIYFLIIKIKKEDNFGKKIITFIFKSFLILFAAFLLLSAILLASNGFYIHSISIVVLIFLIAGLIKSYFLRKNNNNEF
ncbi:MAG: hypothetical protein FWE72_09500 [Spirochaetaceae bacterium]|nr:hypothetical protein [Spirochaetaceae bacterium]